MDGQWAVFRDTALALLAMADELFSLVLAGKIKSEPKQTFALADAADAHRALESRKTVGATVLVP
jgi:NADPH2:quinone reductase